MRGPSLPIVDEQPRRPKTRGDCERGPRPCPWVACRHHLRGVEIHPGYLQVGDLRIVLDADDATFEAFSEAVAERLSGNTCALDIVRQYPDGATLEDVGAIFDLTRERIRQLEARALRRLPKRVSQTLVQREDLREPKRRRGRRSLWD